MRTNWRYVRCLLLNPAVFYTVTLYAFLSSPQLLMCGTGDINVQDFKAHAVIVGGSWHFREKVCPSDSCFIFLQLDIL